MCSTLIAQPYKSHHEDVDQPIAKVKSSKVENKTIQVKFATIGCAVYIGRYYYCHRLVASACCCKMGNLVRCCLCYAKNLPEITAIVESFEESGVLVTQAKVSNSTSQNQRPL